MQAIVRCTSTVQCMNMIDEGKETSGREENYAD